MLVQARVFSVEQDLNFNPLFPPGHNLDVSFPPGHSFETYGKEVSLTPSQDAARTASHRFAAAMVRDAHLGSSGYTHGLLSMTGLRRVPGDKKLGVLLAGPPGIGKTHLVDAALRHTITYALSRPLARVDYDSSNAKMTQAVERSDGYLKSLASSERVWCVDPEKLRSALDDPTHTFDLALSLIFPPSSMADRITVGRSATGDRAVSGWKVYFPLSQYQRKDVMAVQYDFADRLKEIVKANLLDVLRLIYGHDAVSEDLVNPEMLTAPKTIDLSAYLERCDTINGLFSGYAVGNDGYHLVSFAVDMESYGKLILVRGDVEAFRVGKPPLLSSDPPFVRPWILTVDGSKTDALVCAARYMTEPQKRLDIDLIVIENLFAEAAGHDRSLAGSELQAFEELVMKASLYGIRLLMTTNLPVDVLQGAVTPAVASRLGRLQMISMEGEDRHRAVDF